MRINTILCAVDGSPLAGQAVAWAVALARQFAARVSVLEVIDWTLPPVAGLIPEFAEVPPEIHAEISARLEELARPAREHGVLAETGVCSGPIVPTILRRADELPADLIVLGTHGRSGFERLAMGSVAETVLRKSSVPVLTVPPRAGSPAERPFRCIFCAVDLSTPSMQVLRTAAAIALRTGGELTVTHVVEWPFGPTVGGGGAELLAMRRDKAQAQLATLLASADLPPVTLKTFVRVGKPRDLILGGAVESHADLIVLGVSRHNALDRALLGSTTRGVILASACAVLTVR